MFHVEQNRRWPTKGSHELGSNLIKCFLTSTTETTHKLINENLHLSPLYKGDIVGTIHIIIPGKKTIKEDLISAEDINKMSPLVRAKSILKYLIYGDTVDK